MATTSRGTKNGVLAVAVSALLVGAITIVNPGRPTATNLTSQAVVEEPQEQVPMNSKDRDIRARQLIFHSEDLKDVPEIWERAWAREMPDVATPYRVHGGVI